MNTNKNSYTLIYATAMVVIVALLLALISGGLKEIQVNNVKLDKKKQILKSLNIDTENKDIEGLYDEYIIGGIVVNAQGEEIDNSRETTFDVDFVKEMAKPEAERELPVFIASVGGSTKYVLSLRGAGLWGPIWGYIALDDDGDTIFGSYYSHASETPGLGAEIATEHFQKEFISKKIMRDGKFTSIAIVKPGKETIDRDYVDGISGGTITSKGVEVMLKNCLGQYENYLQKTDK